MMQDTAGVSLAQNDRFRREARPALMGGETTPNEPSACGSWYAAAVLAGFS